MSESAQREGRSRKRHSVEATIDVFDASRGERLGTLVNIHTEGLMIAGGKALKADHVYQLELKLPESLLGSDSIRLGVDCLWVREADSGSMSWGGCQIIDASELARRQIEAMIGSESVTNSP